MFVFSLLTVFSDLRLNSLKTLIWRQNQTRIMNMTLSNLQISVQGMYANQCIFNYKNAPFSYLNIQFQKLWAETFVSFSISDECKIKRKKKTVLMIRNQFLILCVKYADIYEMWFCDHHIHKHLKLDSIITDWIQTTLDTFHASVSVSQGLCDWCLCCVLMCFPAVRVHHGLESVSRWAR